MSHIETENLSAAPWDACPKCGTAPLIASNIESKVALYCDECGFYEVGTPLAFAVYTAQVEQAAAYKSERTARNIRTARIQDECPHSEVFVKVTHENFIRRATCGRCGKVLYEQDSS